jgi:hypothetical protein
MTFRERTYIAKVEVSQYLEYAPFTIDLPADVQEITGIYVGVNADVYARGAGTIGLPNSVSAVNGLEKFLVPYPSKLKLKNQTSGYFLTKEIPITAGGMYRIAIKTKTLFLGKCTFKTNFGGAGIFYIQDIYPSQAVFRFANGTDLRSEVVSYGKPGVPFSTVSVGGKAGEISGFLEWDKDQNWTVLGKTTNPTFLANNNSNDGVKYLSKNGITLTIYIRYR